jgi:quinol monooxygenase YgiN
MSVVVVAVIHPQEGRTQDVLDAFSRISPEVHTEAGCELYAAHTDGTRVVMVERWSSLENLQAHSGGAALSKLNGIVEPIVSRPNDVYVLENVPFGDPIKATIQ